ncbi:MAG: tRNA (adenosine(37)-N6)-threonylcarbamoyltransferase complex ATPase subunit type 1 TsaE [Candidatus Niyogibacteria bacterium CG10_big_fil_rev_8_21_14_0_10_46_36]|uniref:tRNA threonylcarbamoyladenosine biosynthesis protein TsaE n=1 Tax=Candidatus Niyogibacteria bacterium CG10_big_fil_rev_8_21_14_0_10_46_36 TaxID=1974726 RepID=A0A2H0TDF6_9BACT|nr:MAG: tRNA (adenosine(37)-N6)-threonylcarbamoyltransferase complex ATPase subunit type 1 TsaE [Candidatus Niyogibacteria bacterium CG10_big_fil_rev_8_21_14_0_10_46_36]
MQLFHYTSESEKETKRFGAAFARAIQALSSKGALVVGLSGDLGSGKTTCMKGVALGFGIRVGIQSPTFVLLKSYTIKKSRKHTQLHHIDAYRLRSAKDITSLGWGNIFSDPKNIIFIEWPERIVSFLPKQRFEIRFRHKKGTMRGISVSLVS